MEQFNYNGKSFPVKAQVAGERLMSIYNAEKKITPKIVLADAKKKSSPLHPCFEWNNDIAAEKYRIDQAGDLIRSITVIRRDNDKDVEIRSFVSIKRDTEEALTTNPLVKGNSYFVSVNDAISDPQLQRYTIEVALRDLKYFMKKYESLKELAGLFALVKETVLKEEMEHLQKSA